MFYRPRRPEQHANQASAEADIQKMLDNYEVIVNKLEERIKRYDLKARQGENVEELIDRLFETAENKWE